MTHALVYVQKSLEKIKDKETTDQTKKIIHHKLKLKNKFNSK